MTDRSLVKTMPWSFYSFAAFLNLLIAAMALTEAWLYFMVGVRMMYLGSYPTWLIATAIFLSLQGAVMLKYFSVKRYTASFFVATAFYIVAVLFVFINFGMISMAVKADLYVPVYVLMLILQLAYNATVVVSASRERTWLRIAGGYGTLHALITLVLICVVVSGKFIEYHHVIEKFHGPLLLAGTLVPLTLAMNFYREMEATPNDNQSGQRSEIFTYASPIAAMAALYFIVSFALDGNQMRSWAPSIDAALRKVAEPFEARTYVNAKGDTLKYRLLKPLDPDASKRYPIVTCLHGSSGTGNDNYTQVAAALLPEFLSHGSNREKFQAFVFVPQCTFGTSWGGVHPLPGIDQIVFEAMASVEKEFPVDTTRRYVTGISLGGYGTWHFIESHPDLFAAAIPICGEGNPALASQCVNVPVWAFHGENDERVPVRGSRDMINALQAAGGNPKYTEFPDTGHDIGKRVCETPGLLDWLFAQQCNDSIPN